MVLLSCPVGLTAGSDQNTSDLPDSEPVIVTVLTAPLPPVELGSVEHSVRSGYKSHIQSDIYISRSVNTL